MPRVVIAPDSFKGTITAAQAADAIAEGIRSVRDDVVIIRAPMADGGEGTLDALLGACEGMRREVATTDPLGRPIQAELGLIEGAATAVIETASAAGLTLISQAERNPSRTSSFGVGTMIAAALDAGVSSIILAVGGSATVDGGAGMIQALGVVLTDRMGRPLPLGISGGRLAEIGDLRAATMHPALRDARVTIATDVFNPAFGEHGAARIFGPQKGADAAMVQMLDKGMIHWCGLLEEISGRPLSGEPGTGAAGGIALPLLALAQAEIVPGVDLVMNAIGLAEQIADADLVITGEGCIDGQTRMGKVIDGVTRLADGAGVPLAGVCGRLGNGHESVTGAMMRCISLEQLGGSADAAMCDTAALLRRAGAALADLIPA